MQRRFLGFSTRFSFDFKYLIANLSKAKQNLKNRNCTQDLDSIIEMYEARKHLEFELNKLSRRKNECAAQINQLRKQSSSLVERQGLVETAKRIKAEIVETEKNLKTLSTKLNQEAFNIPNWTDDSVPIGDESHAMVLETVGKPLERSNLETHEELVQKLNLADFVRAGKVSGSGFYYLKNQAAMLELALCRYAMDFCSSRGFEPIITPDIIRLKYLSGCGFSPRSDDPQTFFVQTDSEADKCLTATAEFPLIGMYSDETLSNSLPIKMVGMGHCFRAEGMHGSLNKGLYRVHQFTKVEMVQIVKQANSNDALNEILEIQKELYTSLGLCFRVLLMPSGDLGAPAFKKYDIEAWMPGRKQWGEISSASNCTDYQSRRLGIRYLANNENNTSFAHTVNGTAIAVSRILVALLETHQTSDGVILPGVLANYMSSLEIKV